MTDDAGQRPDSKPTGADSSDIADLQADIERTRNDLAETVDKLAAKLDIKSRLRSRVSAARDDSTRRLRVLRSRTSELQQEANPQVIGIAAGVLAVFLGIFAMVRGRRRRSNSSWARLR